MSLIYLIVYQITGSSERDNVYNCSTIQVKPTLLYGNQNIYEKIYHRLVTLYQEKTGVEKLLIDWSNCTVREGAATPESQRKLGAIPQTIAKNTVCKKFKVF